jgi:transcriptional regulator of acetoin/glycerol metabolism
LGDGKIIDVADLPPSVLSQAPADLAPSMPTSSASSSDLEDIERATIQRVFEQVNGDKVMAGKMLGISRATLYRKLKRYNIGPQQEISAGAQRIQ